MKAGKKKLIDLVMQRGYDEATARALILGGHVQVNEHRETRAGLEFRPDIELRVNAPDTHASRGAGKLLGALADAAAGPVAPRVRDRICLDLGASHGGFSEVLLRHGARRVYAVDVAYGIFDYNLRCDARIVVLEKTNARDISPAWFDPADLAELASETLFVTADLSFVSIKRILDALANFSKDTGIALECLLLIKPQFEASAATQRGVLKDEAVRTRVLDEVREHARRHGFEILGLMDSRVHGAKGNREAFLFARLQPMRAD